MVRSIDEAIDPQKEAQEIAQALGVDAAVLSQHLQEKIAGKNWESPEVQEILSRASTLTALARGNVSMRIQYLLEVFPTTPAGKAYLESKKATDTNS